MRIDRIALIALLGTTSCGAFALDSLAKGKDNWLTQGAFKRAQERGLESGSEEWFPEEASEWDGVQIFAPRKRRVYQFESELNFENGDPEPQIFTPRKRKRAAEFDEFDPEPDYSAIQGKPKSPDDGFSTYQPVKLVSLSDPNLRAPLLLLANPLATAIFKELQRPAVPVSVTKRQRDAIIGFYRQNDFAPLWVTPTGTNGKARTILAHLAKAEDEGLNTQDYVTSALPGADHDASNIVRDIASLARFEISLTAMALRYAEHVHGGRIVPTRMSGYYDLAPPELHLTHVLYTFSRRDNPEGFLASLAPSHFAYGALKAALAEMRAKSNRDARQPVPAGEHVKVGGRDARVPLVRNRMVELGFLSDEGSLAWILGHSYDDMEDASVHEATLDKELSKALKAFQAEKKIKRTGHIDEATVEALNAPPDEGSVEKLILNMERLRWLPRDLGQRHILVNQAAFALNIYEGQNIIWNTKVIVGKPETQTYVFSDRMETVVVNPYWGVPKSILVHEMLPQLLENPYYLDDKGYEVVDVGGQVVSSGSVDWWSYGDRIPFDVRQPPSNSNALGNIKFLFPNSHDIYMHDTPTKKLFKKAQRAFSHGCVRVENPRKLAEYVLGWDRQKIDELIGSGANREIKLKSPLPVHLNYFTAWPDETGKVAFYADIYKRDARLAKALTAVTVASN
jgi:L,D-transpeptidase YcbB